MNVAKTLRQIAEDLKAMEQQLEAGHEVDTWHLSNAATRLRAQAEMLERGLVG